MPSSRLSVTPRIAYRPQRRPLRMFVGLVPLLCLTIAVGTLRSAETALTRAFCRLTDWMEG